MKPSCDFAAELVMNTLEENLPEPNIHWSDELFEEQSYARWAVYELANRLMDRPYEFADLIVQDFTLEMIGYMRETKDPAKKRIFKAAIEAAYDILTLF